MNSIDIPKHIALIMDGNRRWANKKNMPAEYGHKKGAETLKNIVISANELGIKYLTVYAFSTENWKRSKEEIRYLMLILKESLKKISKKANNINIRIIGQIEELETDLQNIILDVTEKTKDNTGLILNIAFNYGGRREIIEAVKNIHRDINNGKIKESDINEELFSNYLYTKGIPDPDLVIRTSGEFRTSNFLPWQITYSELYFPNMDWPDFTKEELEKAIVEVYQKRDRRFGGK